MTSVKELCTSTMHAATLSVCKTGIPVDHDMSCQSCLLFIGSSIAACCNGFECLCGAAAYCTHLMAICTGRQKASSNHGKQHEKGVEVSALRMQHGRV